MSKTMYSLIKEVVFTFTLLNEIEKLALIEPMNDIRFLVLQGLGKLSI